MLGLAATVALRRGSHGSQRSPSPAEAPTAAATIASLLAARATRATSLDYLTADNTLDKMTWAASDPVAARRFFTRFLPAAKASDGCLPACACGVQGRVSLNGSSGLGLHATREDDHPTGPLGVADVERIFSAKLGGRFARGYVDVLDHHVAIWDPMLNFTVGELAAAGQPFFALEWNTTVDATP